MIKKTEALWSERITAWRASGKTAQAFAQELGVHPVTLRGWMRRLDGRAVPPAPSKPAVKFAQVVRATPAASSRAPIVIELADARIVVTADADERALTIALRALGAAR